MAGELLVEVADDDLLVLQQQAGLHEVVQRREAHLDPGRHHGEDHGEAQAHVAHHGAPHQPPALVLAVDVRADEDGDGVGPGDAGVLVPPALHDDGDVEAQHEGQRDEVAVRLAVLDHGLEHNLLLLVEGQAVRQVERVVQEEEGGQVRPHQLVNAAPPSYQQFEETAEAPAGGDFAGVRHRHGYSLLARHRLGCPSKVNDACLHGAHFPRTRHTTTAGAAELGGARLRLWSSYRPVKIFGAELRHSRPRGHTCHLAVRVVCRR